MQPFEARREAAMKGMADDFCEEILWPEREAAIAWAKGKPSTPPSTGQQPRASISPNHSWEPTNVNF